MKALIILNDPPYGTERSYNGLRLAIALAKLPETEVRVFLMGDAVGCARAGQQTATGYYNMGRMLTWLIEHGVQVHACGSCVDARGLPEESLVSGAVRGSMEELAQWNMWAEKIIVF